MEATEITLPLLKGNISLHDALREDGDILKELSYPKKRVDFWLYLFRHRSKIAEIVSRHLGIPEASFKLGEVEEWIHGSFNACIIIYITDPPAQNPNLPQRAIIRFPLPYKVGEAFCPGNVDEKLRVEAATYIWLQSNCAAVPTPRLLGFGFPGTQSFTALECERFYNKIVWYFRRATLWMSGHTLPPYVAHSRQDLLDVGYLIIEHVGEEGRMLSESWEENRHDQDRRTNLFRDLSRIMLSLAKLPLPRIGSWTMDNRGILSLTNRPLTFLLHQLENTLVPTDMPRDLTYTSIEPYFLDLIACQDNRIRHQPNSIHSKDDGEAQLAALTAMRALLPKFTDRSLRHGPFITTLTDFHQSNIFVDDDWHITRIIDLEWACTRPVEMLGPPYWLSSQHLDGIIHEHLDEYAKVHKEFMDVFEREEFAIYQSVECTRILRNGWKTKSFWYSLALDCPTALYALFVYHIQPRFAKLSNAALDEFSRVVMPYWDQDALKFISSKTKEQEQYSNQVREAFAPVAPNSFDRDDKKGEKEESRG